jgi:Na+/H+ antiporter NhaC
MELETRKEARASFVWLPLSVMTMVLLSLILPQGFPFERLPSGAFISSLSTSYLFASITLVLLMAYFGVKKIEEGFIIYFKSIGSIVSVLIVLVLAWSLGAISKDLQTAQYIVSLAKGGFSPALIPAVAFVIGSIISFSTGSSWGTYAIMLPLIISVAHELGSPMYVCIGAVLSGGLFGDHSSPISDTTIVSATGAGCSPLDHVRTQLPYALVNGAVCIIAFIIAGMTGSVWSLLLGFLMLVGAVFAFNRLSA